MFWSCDNYLVYVQRMKLRKKSLLYKGKISLPPYTYKMIKCLRHRGCQSRLAHVCSTPLDKWLYFSPANAGQSKYGKGLRQCPTQRETSAGTDGERLRRRVGRMSLGGIACVLSPYPDPNPCLRRHI